MHKIVAGVDGSRASLWALRWSLHEAFLREIPLHVARVFRPAGWGDEENGRTHATAGPRAGPAARPRTVRLPAVVAPRGRPGLDPG